MSEQPQHHAVLHPVRLRIKRHRGGMSPVGRVNDFLLTHLAVVFGLAWTVWIFMTVTVAAYWMPAALQAKIFFFSSGCIQLFALPLMVYVGNKLQRSSDAQSEVMHQALTHIATVSDQLADLLDLATPGGLTTVHADTKAARSAAESAFVATQALAAVATTPSPAGGPGTSGKRGQP